MQSILVTGAYGFVGTNLARDLAGSNDYSSVALDLIAHSDTHYDGYFSWKDLDRIKWDSLDAIIHLAGKAHDTNNCSDPQSYFDINFGLTKIVFNKFLESKAEKFIFFSSVKAVADTVNGSILTENCPPNPQTPYGQSKLLAEQYILGQKLPAEKRVYILRPCMIHGPGNKGNLNLLYNIVAKGVPYPLGRFQNLRSLSSIKNIIFIVRELIDKAIEPGIYQICDDTPVSTLDIITLIAQSINQKPRIWNISRDLISSIAKIGDRINIPLNSERLKKLTETYVVSNQKLKTVLGIASLPIASHDGLAYTFKFFHNHEINYRLQL
jgi:nucleoside-diphosphate-sugar epimerase